MPLTAQGPRISVMLNGEVVNEIDLTTWKDGKLNPDGIWDAEMARRPTVDRDALQRRAALARASSFGT